MTLTRRELMSLKQTKNVYQQGNIQGNINGDINGGITGTINGSVSGTINGCVTGTVTGTIGKVKCDARTIVGQILFILITAIAVIKHGQ